MGACQSKCCVTPQDENWPAPTAPNDAIVLTKAKKKKQAAACTIISYRTGGPVTPGTLMAADCTREIVVTPLPGINMPVTPAQPTDTTNQQPRTPLNRRLSFVKVAAEPIKTLKRTTKMTELPVAANKLISCPETKREDWLQPVQRGVKQGGGIHMLFYKLKIIFSFILYGRARWGSVSSFRSWQGVRFPPRHPHFKFTLIRMGIKLNAVKSREAFNALDKVQETRESINIFVNKLRNKQHNTSHNIAWNRKCISSCAWPSCVFAGLYWLSWFPRICGEYFRHSGHLSSHYNWYGIVSIHKSTLNTVWNVD